MIWLSSKSAFGRVRRAEVERDLLPLARRRCAVYGPLAPTYPMAFTLICAPPPKFAPPSTASTMTQAWMVLFLPLTPGLMLSVLTTNWL